MTSRKQYLGDGVYADFDGYALVLTTENGIDTQNTIVIEPTIMEALLRFATTIWNADAMAQIITREREES